jgi:hypothetical protein
MCSTVQTAEVRGMEEDEIDRLKLPQARKEAKTRGIDISNLKNIGEIRCTLKRHLLIDRKTRDSVREISYSTFTSSTVDSVC